MAIVTQGWGTPFEPLTGGYGASTAAAAGGAAPTPGTGVAWPATFFQPLRAPGRTLLDVVRRGETVHSGIVAQIDPIDPRPFEVQQVAAGAAGETLYDRVIIYPLAPALPDIRVRDQLVDTQEVDPLTAHNSTYYVRRVKTFRGSHLEIDADKVATRHTT